MPVQANATVMNTDEQNRSDRRGTSRRAGKRRLPRWRRWLRRTLRTTGLILLVLVVATWWKVLRIEEDPSWPPPPDAVTSAEAREATVAFLQRDDPSIEDLAIPLAPTTVSSVSFYSGGAQFFPPMLEDMAAAESSIHILMFTMTPGEVADDVVDVLTERARAGVEVRMIVDRYGAKVTGKSKGLFERLRAAGVEVVVNDIFPIDRDGPFMDGSIDWSQDEVGNADHRKIVVVDGQVGWIGGAGFEDHFVDGRYHDTFARLTGGILRQMQLVFLTSFHALGGPQPEDTSLERYFPPPIDAGTIPATLLHNVPGGFVPGTQAIREVIDRTDERLEILNPYLIDGGMIDRIVDAGERGVDVTLVGPGASNVPQAQAALHHNYPRLFDVGVEGYEYETIIHAKVIVADDTVVIGTINLDAWALYRNHEIAVMIEDPALADEASAVMVEDVLSRSEPVVLEGGLWNDVKNWFWDKFVYVL